MKCNNCVRTIHRNIPAKQAFSWKYWYKSFSRMEEVSFTEASHFHSRILVNGLFPNQNYINFERNGNVIRPHSDPKYLLCNFCEAT